MNVRKAIACFMPLQYVSDTLVGIVVACLETASPGTSTDINSIIVLIKLTSGKPGIMRVKQYC